MKASIIIPFWDGSRDTMRWTIQSALRQEYYDYEIILVDDGSTDPNTIWSAKYMQMKRTGTKIITQEHQGVVQARNTGFANSDGDVLLFLDADDWIEPTFLQKTAAFMRNDVGIVSTDMHVFSEDKDSIIEAKNHDIGTIIQENTIPNISLISRKAFEEVDGYKSDVFDDWNLWVSILKRGWKTAFVPEPLVHYRLRSNGNRGSILEPQRELMMQNMRKLHPELLWP